MKTPAELREENAALRRRIEQILALHRVHVFRTELGMKPAVAKTLNVLYEAPGFVKSRLLEELVRVDRSTIGRSDVSTVYIRHIRTELGDDAILTRYGAGYRLQPEARAELDALLTGLEPD